MRHRIWSCALAVSIVLCALASTWSPQRSGAQAIHAGPGNIRVSHGRYLDYGEPSLAVDPRDPHNLLGAAQCFNGPALPRPCTFASFDGGRSWRDNGPLPLPAGDRGGGDVTVAFDARGHGFVAAHAGAGWNVDSVLVWRTADGGRTFAPPVTVFRGHRGSTVVDHPSLAVDTAGGVAIAWTAADDQDIRHSRLLFSRSADGGQHFAAPRVLGRPAAGYPGIPVMAAGPAGAIHVVFAVGQARDPMARPYAPMARYVVSSPDMGRHFGAPYPIGVAPGFGIVVAGQNMANIQAAAVDPHDGTLYVALVAYRPHSQRTMIVLWRSRDGGVTWRGPQQVDDEPGADAADHTQPQIAVTPHGTVYVSYFGWVHGRVDVYLAASGTQGATFSAAERITTTSFDPTLSDQQREGSPWIGDYQGLAVGGDRVYPFWNDTRTGHLQIFVAAVLPLLCC
jgi:hypothetical protein